jgi:hypothetical protein
MNRLALSWVDTCLGLEEDYRRLWAAFCDVRRAYLLLHLQLQEEREAWARAEAERRFPEREAA